MVVRKLPSPASGLPEGIKTLGLMAFTIAMDQKEVGEAVWGNYVPEAWLMAVCRLSPMLSSVKKGLR